ncbi:MAG: type II CAAX endopeptidase family protein [Acidobacteriaceae bacterium]
MNPDPNPKLVAPLWHTAILLILVLLNSVASARTHNLWRIASLSADPQIAGYLTVILFEWLMVAYIWWGVRLRGATLSDLIRGSWPRWTTILRDLAIAIAFFIVANIVYGTLARLLHVDPGASLKQIMPRGPAETAVYLLLALTAGFCEELIFRGYLFRQFTVLGKSITAGLLLQGIVFGLAHGYQGPKLMLIVTVYGCLFGVLAAWQRSLRPGMIAHALQDAIVVLLFRFMR